MFPMWTSNDGDLLDLSGLTMMSQVVRTGLFWTGLVPPWLLVGSTRWMMGGNLHLLLFLLGGLLFLSWFSSSDEGTTLLNLLTSGDLFLYAGCRRPSEDSFEPLARLRLLNHCSLPPLLFPATIVFSRFSTCFSLS
ncbi:hypothetical protein TNIN_243651 [Trichonephila inaurata madagascariensis]|uniref:Uncharacterized protein n=1 Tax=Trichonephila inaurata madagascariensis TaxID=2747483 RepID=A0A8X7C2V6_9ARAC|nr:hypothetical protein TNIN_243651 [Trichonephila inaurata madagascariensis]